MITTSTPRWEVTRLRILELSSTVEQRFGEGGGSRSPVASGQWDQIHEALLEEGDIGVATFTTLEYVVRTLRFRMHYKHVLDELRFHNVHPEMSVGQMGGELRARSHCRFVLLLNHFAPDSRTESIPLFLKRECDRALPRP